MAVSGSQDFNQTRDEIIKDALILLGVVHEDETVNSSTNNFASRMLNKMVKAWNAQGIHLWGFDEGVVIFDNDIVKYTINTTTDNNVFKASALVQTTFSADEAAAQTVLSVTSSTGMVASDVILMELTSGELDETTIVSVDSATQITVTAGLTTAAASGNHIYVYTSAAADGISGAKLVTSARLRDADGNDRRMTEISREEYYDINNKISEATPTSYYVDYQRADPIMYIWPEPNSLKEQLRFTYTKSLDDFDAGTDNPDLPQEWLEAMTYQLAVRVAPAYGKEVKIEVLAALATNALNLALEWDNEPSDLMYGPEID